MIELNKNQIERLQDLLLKFNGEINVLNAQINIETQIEYFELSKKLKSELSEFDWQEKSKILYNEELSIDEKKRILILIASTNDVKAYRFLEYFYNNCSNELKDWAFLALQESKMLLQSELLDQPQLLISTGLGGKENKLRYFFVLFSRDLLPYTLFQYDIIRTELNFIFSKYDSEIEEINFRENYVSFLALIPIQNSISLMLNKLIDEINQYGNFVSRKCIITNVKILSDEIIRELIDETMHKNKHTE